MLTYVADKVLKEGMNNNQRHETLNNLVLCCIKHYKETFVLRLLLVTYLLSKLLFEKRQPNIVFQVQIEQVKLFLFLVCDDDFFQQFHLTERYEDMLACGKSHVSIKIL